MTELFYDKLNNWKKNIKIKRILIKGYGRAFCAGGDVKSLFLSSGVSDLKKEFLFKEYKLNYLIDQFNKPYLSIWNGIVMGGGVGLSIYGNVRIATENSKFAMPETAIGFFPDVGSSYFLSRIKNNFGLYLSLTGKIISFTEMIYLNLATHFCKSANIQKLESNYIHNGLVSPIDKIDKNSSELIDNKNFIEDTFHGDIFNIFKRLKKSNLEFAKITYQNLLKRCPMSLAVTAELFKKTKKF
jgi:Enoyl-CoA hydratase/carnithine racemase